MPGAFLWGYVAIEGDRRNQGGDAGQIPELSQTFSPRQETQYKEIISEVSTDINQLSESLGQIRNKIIGLVGLPDQTEELTHLTQSRVSIPHPEGELPLTEDAEKIRELSDAVLELDDAITLFNSVQNKVEVFISQQNQYDHLSELFKDATVRPEDKFPNNSTRLRANGIYNYGDIVQYSLEELAQLTPPNKSGSLGIGYAKKYEKQLQSVGLHLRK